MGKYDWSKALLVDNPFISTPPLPHEEVIWADMSEQKTKLQNRLRSALSTSPTSLILNYGPWGGGKTHAARYFSQTEVLREISNEIGVVSPLSLVINLPRGTKNVIKAIFTDILDTVGLKVIRHSLSDLADSLDDQFSEITRAFVKSEEFVVAFLMLAGQQQESGQLSLVSNEQIDPALKRYFLANATSGDLKELGLSRKIETGSDMIGVLSAILNLLLYSTSSTEPQFSEIILWFDEMEEIISLPGREQTTLSSLIRDLTDFVPQDLTMFVNFTPRPGGKIEEVSSYLGPAVWSRFKEHIEFYSLDRQHIEEYIIELLNSPKFRPDRFREECPDEYYPFDAESVGMICDEFEQLEGRAVPRYINEVCSLIIEHALAAHVLDEEGATIGVDFVHEMSQDIRDTLQYR